MAVPKRRPRKKPETILSDAIREALAWEPGLILWRNSVGTFRAHGCTVTAGLPPGSADLVGLLSVNMALTGAYGSRVIDAMKIGRFVALEIKVPGEKADPHQLEWLASVRSFGGFACVVTSVLEALTAIRRARGGAIE